MKPSDKCMCALVALLAVTVPSALTATVTYQSFQNNSQLFMTSGSYFYGNDVILRSDVVMEQALMSWVDQATVLPAGWLTRFFLHTFIAVGVPATSPPVPVRLQIWRPLGVMQFQLVWEYRLLMINNINSNQGVFVQVVLDKTEQFHVRAGDKVGWTCEGDVCPLCFSELDGTIISQNTALPDISTSPVVTFQVDPNGLYGLFSVAVEVTPDLVQIGSQGPAGSPGSVGATGHVGSTGATGAAGPQGVNSVPGADGVAGGAGLQGATGPAGLQGPSGLQGHPGIELVGPAGPQGPAGPPGSSSGNPHIQAKSDPRLNAAIIGIVVPLSVLTILILVLIVCLACKLRAKDKLKRSNSLNYNQHRDSNYGYGLEDNSVYNQFDKDYSYGANHKPSHYDDDI